jgi:tetratricopeptide (TPR) repeat protein
MVLTRLVSNRLTPLLFGLLTAALPLHADRQQADALVLQGRVDEASALLKQTLTAQPEDAHAHQLLCRLYYAQEMADPAIHECERAAANAPNDSDTYMWLARAYGMKASTANPLSAFSLAKKVRVSFERAVRLDGTNVQAMSDLGQFYVAAPAIVGGGLDKAQRLADQIKPYSSARACRLLAQIAVKKKDAATAEAEYKAAVAAANKPEAYIDLAQFYVENGKPDQAVATLKAGIDANRAKDAALVDTASILTTVHRSPDLAEHLLRDYLASSAKSDEAPAFKVHIQLGDLLLHRGDSAGARREYAAALALASNYTPARKAMEGA